VPSTFLRVWYIRCTLATPKQEEGLPSSSTSSLSHFSSLLLKFLLLPSRFLRVSSCSCPLPRALLLVLASPLEGTPERDDPPSPRSSSAGSTSDPVVSPINRTQVLGKHVCGVLITVYEEDTSILPGDDLPDVMVSNVNVFGTLFGDRIGSDKD